MRHDIFITGGTGYHRSRLILLLMQRGHHVMAVARTGAEHKLPEAVPVSDVLRICAVAEMGSPA